MEEHNPRVFVRHVFMDRNNVDFVIAECLNGNQLAVSESIRLKMHRTSKCIACVAGVK